jgi:5'-nucleotidase
VRLILTNDDGIDAPGLAALARAASGLGDLQIVAPSGPQSGCGHVVTTHRPVEFARRHASSASVSGTPADCVRLALHHLATGANWVLSGINAGGNLGADVYHSGTVAAAREAAFHGVPAIAVSHYIAKGLEIDWDRAVEVVGPILRKLMARPCPRGHFWNVNLPHPLSPDAEWVECPVDTSPHPLVYQLDGDRAQYVGNYHERPRQPGADVATCLGGRIAASLVSL